MWERLQMEKQRLTPLPIKFVCFSVNKVDFHLRFAAKGCALHLREILDRWPAPPRMTISFFASVGPLSTILVFVSIMHPRP